MTADVIEALRADLAEAEQLAFHRADNLHTHAAIVRAIGKLDALSPPAKGHVEPSREEIIAAIEAAIVDWGGYEEGIDTGKAADAICALYEPHVGAVGRKDEGSVGCAIASPSRALIDDSLSEGGRGPWRLVPAKHDGRAGLTHEMCDAFWRAYEEADEHHGHFESTSAGYNAMLDAAPVQPSSGTPTPPSDGEGGARSAEPTEPKTPNVWAVGAGWSEKTLEGAAAAYIDAKLCGKSLADAMRAALATLGLAAPVHPTCKQSLHVAHPEAAEMPGRVVPPNGSDFDALQIEQDAFRGLEVQACEKTQTISFCAWDNGGHDNQQSCALTAEQVRELYSWLGRALSPSDTKESDAKARGAAG